jgi:putative transposase
VGTALGQVTEVLRSLYLRGLSTKDFEPAPAEFFCSEAGLRASTIQRLTREWSAQLAGFRQRDLSQVDYVYQWARRTSYVPIASWRLQLRAAH